MQVQNHPYSLDQAIFFFTKIKIPLTRNRSEGVEDI